MSHFAKQTFDKMVAAIDLCRSQGLDVPMLTLNYTLLDALAWAAYGGAMSGVKDRFIHFCEQHLLPGSSLDCAALDLYAARCSTLHTLGWESDLSRNGKAKSMAYSFGTDDAVVTQQVLERVAPGRFVTIKADLLVRATQAAVHQIRALANSNEALKERLAVADGKGYRTLATNDAAPLFSEFLRSTNPSGSISAQVKSDEPNA